MCIRDDHQVAAAPCMCVCVVTSFGNPCAGRLIRGSSRSLLAKVLFILSPMYLSLGPPAPRVLTGEDHKMLYPFPGPQSVPPQKINPKGLCPMESNVFDVVSLTSTCSHCPPSLVPCPPLKK